MARTVFNNGITVAVGAFGSSPLLDDSLVGIINDYDISIAYDEYARISTAMRIRMEKALSVSQKYGYRIAGKELPMLADGANKQKRVVEYGNKKGYLTKNYGAKIETTYLMGEYLRTQQTLAGASGDVQEEYVSLIQNTKDLQLGRLETSNIENVALFTQGFAATASYGPGSYTPNLEPLFSATHPILSTGGTFSNVLSTINKALSNTYLQEALNILKTGVKLQSGKYVKQGTGTFYQLLVGTNLAVTARQILNTYGKQAGMYAGTANNANLINQFFFEGNLVEIVEMPNIGDLVAETAYGYGSTLGAQTNWFVMNPFVIDKQQSLKAFQNYAPVMKNYQKRDNDIYVVDIRANYGVDHFYAETGIVGSQGTT